MKASKPVGPILLPLPPAGGPQVAQWEVAAVKMLADAGRLPGYARVRIRVGLVDDERRLPDLLPPIGAALTRARLVDDELVADLEAAWDRVVPAGSVVISVFPTTAPAMRSDAATRAKVSEAQRRRWAAARASVL